MISVHAWNRLKRGIISSSSKVAAFLSSLSENNIDIKHCPGVNTKVADYGSRNPPTCSEKRCQICSYITEQCQIGEHCNVNSISVQDILSGTVRPPLTEKPAWIRIQKEDDTHNKLFHLINSGGLQPEKKLRGHMDLKLLYNKYRKGLLKIDASGLIVVQHIDPASGKEYEAISVPKNVYPAVIQSLHIKLCHPSKNQMHKFVHRYFHCIGSTSTIEDIHSSCQTCTSLSLIKPIIPTHTTVKNSTFGSSFSADVLVSENQKIFICREKLSQYTFSKIISDESAMTMKEAILDAVLEIIPPSGTIIQVDAAPGLQSLSNSLASLTTDDVLKSHNISIDIGRIHNPNKNPVAENAIKEFRKEILRLKPRGGAITETERIIITKNINSRIRNRGFSAKEIFLRRELSDNSPADICDDILSSSQHDLRCKVNAKHNIQSDTSDSQFEVGDRVYIKNDLTKTRAREEYIITSLESDDKDRWATLQKIESQFRKKSYRLKLNEIIHVSTNFPSIPEDPERSDSSQDTSLPPFHGFPSQNQDEKSKLDDIVSDLQSDIPKSKGRPKKKKFPGYVQDIFDSEPFHGYPSQVDLILTDSMYNSNTPQKDPLLYGYNQDDFDSDDEDEDICYFQKPSGLINQQSNTTSERSPTSNESEDQFFSDDDLSSTHSAPNYVSSDDDPFEHKQESWWETPQLQNRLRSETDPYFLYRAQIVSTDSSSLDSPVDLDITLIDEPERDLQPEQLPQVQNRVFDFTAALDAINAPLQPGILNLASLPNPDPLPTLRASSRQTSKIDYKHLHKHGFDQS